MRLVLLLPTPNQVVPPSTHHNNHPWPSLLEEVYTQLWTNTWDSNLHHSLFNKIYLHM